MIPSFFYTNKWTHKSIINKFDKYKTYVIITELIGVLLFI